MAIWPKKGKYLDSAAVVNYGLGKRGPVFQRVPGREPAGAWGVNGSKGSLTKRDSEVFLGVSIMIVGVLVTFLVIILVLYLVNMLPIDGRAKQICRVIVIILGVLSLLKYIAVF
jgi:hypothetical protein